MWQTTEWGREGGKGMDFLYSFLKSSYNNNNNLSTPVYTFKLSNSFFAHWFKSKLTLDGIYICLEQEEEDSEEDVETMIVEAVTTTTALLVVEEEALVGVPVVEVLAEVVIAIVVARPKAAEGTIPIKLGVLQ